MTTAPQAKPSAVRQELSLNDAATHVLEECRTVVPGMQALFGFQLIAVSRRGSSASSLRSGWCFLEQCAELLG